MSYELTGTPSHKLPGVLASGSTDVHWIFASLSSREKDGRDADYLKWHSLDHRPEQFRLRGIRHSLRLVSTPDCRNARAASNGKYDEVDHVMTYFFTRDAAFDQFADLSDALQGDRRPFVLPSVDAGYFALSGKLASTEAVAGADVIPWRPAVGVYLILEQFDPKKGAEGSLAPNALLDIKGIAGIWRHRGSSAPAPNFDDNHGFQLSYCYLDDDPVVVARRIEDALNTRWSNPSIKPLLAAPFYSLVPFEWERYLP